MKNIRFLLLIISMMLMPSVMAQVSSDVYYEPELLMISQPKMEFYDSSESDYAQFYFDVKNIGSETYKGEFLILMEPDVDHYYAKKSIKVKAGAVKRIKMELDLGMIYYDSVYTVLPVYEFENQWYPLTAYEEFKPIMLCLSNASYSSDLVVTTEPEPVYDYYYDVRLQRPPVYGYYYVTPPPGCAYAYGYNTCCINNYYIVVNENGNTTGGGNTQTGNIGNRPSAPRVSHNHYSTSASYTGGSSRRTSNGSGNYASPSSSRPSSTGTANPTTTTTSRPSSTSSGRSSSSVSNSSNSRQSSSSTYSSSSRPSNNSSSTISNSSSSISSSSGNSSGSSSRSSSSSNSSSSSTSSSSRGGRR